MGNLCGKPALVGSSNVAKAPRGSTSDVKKVVKCKWTSEEPMTRAQLQSQREQFWDTQPHYGGNKVIWDALKAACESDLQTATVIIESAGIIVAKEDMSICYDETGCRYDLPPYVLSDPTNLVQA